MQRFCEGCRCQHDLEDFDLDRDEAATICRARMLSQAQTLRTGARRLQRSKIEALEQKRRSLIAALVKIDQAIARERTLRDLVRPVEVVDPANVFGTEGDLDTGD